MTYGDLDYGLKRLSEALENPVATLAAAIKYYADKMAPQQVVAPPQPTPTPETEEEK